MSNSISSNSISSIPEIDDMIFAYLDPVNDLKHLMLVSHHYKTIVNNIALYRNIAKLCVDSIQMIHEIETAINTWFMGEINIFDRACWFGYLDVAKYLCLNRHIDIRAAFDRAFRWSCRTGHFEIAFWLHCITNGHNLSAFIRDYTIRYSVEGNHLDITIWLYNIYCNVPRIKAGDDVAWWRDQLNQ